MRVCYSRRRDFHLPARKLLVAATGMAVAVSSALGLEAVFVNFKPAPAFAAGRFTSQAQIDPRTLKLKKFLSGLHCPVASLSEDFVHAADDNHLDWRLLPSIAVIESGGGKAYKRDKNNIFGWGGGELGFPTVRAGLNEVAYKLGRSPLYRRHNSLGKLHLYNPDENYAQQVMTVMRRISPVVNILPEAETVVRSQDEYVYAEADPTR